MKNRMAAGGMALGAMAIATPFIIQHEGNIYKTYADPIGIPTVCAGVTGRDIRFGQIYTKAECDKLNAERIEIANEAVRRHVKVKISAETEAALTSFTYNVGEGALAHSTLLRKLNAGDIEGACNELPRWIYAGGKKLRGLVNRRAEEKKLCLSGIKPTYSWRW